MKKKMVLFECVAETGEVGWKDNDDGQQQCYGSHKIIGVPQRLQKTALIKMTADLKDKSQDQECFPESGVEYSPS